MSPLTSNLLFIVAVGHLLVSALPTVQILLGAINGAKCPTTDVNSFLGIPFAQAPIGDLRFAPPAPYQSSFPDGGLVATQKPSSCIQFGSVFGVLEPQSEDCLFLNIWAPQNANRNSSLPVKVWIHGGGEESGSITESLYNGCFLAIDSIVVSIAYRLGPIGFLALESAEIGGNFGVQDILLGLEWIQSNIAAFGGDPTKVLLFGQSAGAQLVWYISTLAKASSLIHAVIGQSGAGQPLPNNSEYQDFGKQYATTLGCNITDITCFRSKSITELVNSTTILSLTYLETLQRFQPFLDGKIIPVDPLIAGSSVPLIAGSTAMEGTIFILGQYIDPRLISETNYSSFLNYTFQDLASNVSNYYPMSAYASSDLPGYYAMSAVITDSYFKCPTYRALQATIKGGIPAWTYLDNHTPTCGWANLLNDSIILELLGPTHTSDIPFVFAELTNLPPPNGDCSFDMQEVQISRILTSAWTSMAVNGNPYGGLAISGGPWPNFNASASQGLLINDEAVIGYVNYTNCAFWDAIAAAQNASAYSIPSSTTSKGPTPSPTTSGVSMAFPSNGGGQMYSPVNFELFSGMMLSTFWAYII